MAAHRSRAYRTVSSRHLRFLATQRPSPFGLGLAGGRVKERCHTILKKWLPFCQCHYQSTSPYSRCNARCWCWEWPAAVSRRSRGHSQAGDVLLNSTGCHIYLYPVTMTITTVISLTVSTTSALAPVLELQSRTGIFLPLKACPHQKMKV